MRKEIIREYLIGSESFPEPGSRKWVSEKEIERLGKTMRLIIKRRKNNRIIHYNYCYRDRLFNSSLF